jgi:lipopolysaccharide export system protein LptA
VNRERTWRGWAAALALILAAAVVPATSMAQEKKPTQDEFPLHITADRLEADQKERVIIFIGHVKATYQDSILYCDRLRVFYEQPPPGSKPPAKSPEEKEGSPLGDMGGEKISRIVATGQVRVVQEDKVATGQEATYYRDRDEIVLVGNPQLWRAENTLKGERIIFNMKDNKVLVESSPKKRVEAHLYPQAGSPGTAKPSASGILPAGRPKAPKQSSKPR